MQKKTGKLFATIVFLLIYDGIKSQEFFPGKYITLRTNPLSVFEIDGGFMLGAGYRFSKRFSVNLDPGIILFNLYRETNNANSSHPFGVKIRADVRYHYFLSLGGINNVFSAAEFHFKHTGVTKSTTFGINCIQGQCDYYQFAEYRELKTEYGIAYKTGFQTSISADNKLILEMYGGLGAKFLSFKDKNIPPQGSFPNGTWHSMFRWESETGAYPYLPAGIKLVYKIF